MSPVREATQKLMGDAALRIKIMKLLFAKRRMTSAGCVEWTGRVSHNGYGNISVCRGTFKTHRLAWMFANGQTVPEGKEICHHCDNPPCMNPEHIYAGTRKENVRDMILRRRENFTGISPCKISGAQAVEICKRYSNGEKRSDLAKCFGVKWWCIWEITTGRRSTVFTTRSPRLELAAKDGG